MHQSIAASTFVRSIALGLACFAGAELGHLLSFPGPDLIRAAFWPPAGLLLAALTASEYARWPSLILAACASLLASDTLLHDRSMAVSVCFCLAISVEACVGAWLLRRLAGVPFTLTRRVEVVALACFPAMVSPAFGATIAASAVALNDAGGSFWEVWQAWWTADAVSMLVIAPVLLTWSAAPIEFVKELPAWRIVEIAVLFVGVMLITEGVYGHWLPRTIRVPILILPFLLWGGLRFEPRIATAVVLTVAVIGVWNAAQGHGPFVVPDAPVVESLRRTQGALGMSSLCVLLLAATVAERTTAERERSALLAELQKALAEIKTLRGLIPICAWCKRVRDDQDFWHSVEDYVGKHTEAKFSHGMCPQCLEKAVRELQQ